MSSEFSEPSASVESLQRKVQQLESRCRELYRMVENLARCVQRNQPESEGHIEGFDYFLLETFYRGDRETLKATQESYLKYFTGHNPVIDVGCGRGEFLELLVERGWDAYGVDLSRDMVLLCRDLGLDVQQEDALEHLKELKPDSVGGIFCSQFVEHLPAGRLIEYLELALSRLKPGGVLIAETVNPQCLSVFANTFYVDLTHQNPVHPKTLKFLFESIGYDEVRIEFCSPYPREHMLRRLPEEQVQSSELRALLPTLNFNVDALNYVLFGPQDYAAIGYKPTGDIIGEQREEG